MVLSIGMIVKNEEKYLEKCLTALQPILNELDSELIIADTGSTDRTVEIAKKFTDNVFYFEWVNDFSAARNSTLEKAKGEWFMFIDADEIAQDCTDIISFFKTGEYKRYKSASYVQSSFSNAADLNSTRIDFNVARLVENDGITKFSNPIHELLYPLNAPMRDLNFVVDHYGYLYLDDDNITKLAYEKSERNLSYLFKELEELSDDEINRKRYFVYDQIADCYSIIKQPQKALEYINVGLRKLAHKSIGIIAYYSHKISILSYDDVVDENVDEILETANEYFDPKLHPWHETEYSTDCYVYGMRAYAFYKLHNYNKAIDDCIKFFNLYAKYTKGKLNKDDLLLTVWRVTDRLTNALYDIFFRCCYQEKKYELADDYTKVIPLEKYYDDHGFMLNYLNIRVEIMENVGYRKLDSLYRQLDEFGKNHLLERVRRKAFGTTPQNRAVIIKKLSSLDGLPAEIARIYNGYFEKGNADLDAISDFLLKYGSESGEDMLYILLDSQMDIEPFLMTADFFADRAVQILMIYFPNGTELYENYDINKISPEALVNAISLYGWVMRRALENDHKISKFFKMYSDLGARWDSEFPNSLTVPGDVRAARLAGGVVAAKEYGDRAKFNIAMSDLTTTVPDLIPIANAYKIENGGSLRKVSVNPEFEKLAVQVKHNIRDLISAGNISDARSLLKEFEGICPGDPDIEILRKEINNTLQ